MRVGRGGRKWRPKQKKLGPENTKLGPENRKKWVQKSKKWGGASRVGQEGEGKMRRKRIINNRNKQLKSRKLYVQYHKLCKLLYKIVEN
jgi:hypothetical protein